MARKEPHQLRVYGRSGPSKNIPFPANANITAVELLTFLPNCLQSADVVYRFISNGGKRNTIWAIIHTVRELEGEWSQDTCGKLIGKAMREAGFDKWTMKIHEQWHGPRRPTWRGENLNVAGFRVPCNIGEEGHRAEDIPFEHLAVDVRKWPEGTDALDLTRMVEHCVFNPDEGWEYPRDYEKLLSLLGGPDDVYLEHTDRMAFKRWDQVTPPPPRPRMPQALEPGSEPEEKGRTSILREDTRIEEPRRRKGRPRKGVRLDKKADVVDPDAEKDTGEQAQAAACAASQDYVQNLARWIPPPQSIEEPFEAINTTFLAERHVDETDPYSAYAFAGARHSPPYRPLHRVREPDLQDGSGWAENLRWATEQTLTFGTVGWTESPEHMDRIVQIRREQQWVSGELLEKSVAEKGAENEEMGYPRAF